MTQGFMPAVFGRLNIDSLDFLKAFFHPSLNNIILSGAAWAVIVGAVVGVAALSYFRLWGPLLSKWAVSVDHKKIGVMYIVLALIMLLRGVLEGVVMRFQQADGLGGGDGVDHELIEVLGAFSRCRHVHRFPCRSGFTG